MTRVTADSRYIVKTFDGAPGATDEPVKYYRVYDQETQSYPIVCNGIQVQDHYSTKDHAYRVAHRLNELIG